MRLCQWEIKGKMYIKNCDKAYADLKLHRKGGENFMQQPSQQTKSMKTNTWD
jgi:hypothetical protein